jgi:tripartite-type tricarboxylate transporter receptor subunit TctC
MRLARRLFTPIAGLVAVVATVASNASAFDYPSRPVQLIVGYAAGGPLDTGARLIAQELSKRLGQSFIVANHAGASGIIATEEVVRARPDGYTLLACSSSNAWNASLYDHLSFDFIRDLAPVASYYMGGAVMEVTTSFPVKSVPEFITYAKANPGKINLASGGPGSAGGLYGELFKALAGVDLITVNYRGSAPALPDLIAGRVHVLFDPVITAIGPIKAGKLRGLGVTTAQPIEALPDLPPIGEFVPGYEGFGFQGICAPKDTPTEIVSLLNRGVNAALADPTIKTRFGDLGADTFATSPAEFGKFIVEFTEKWSKVIRAAGLKGVP